MSSSTPWVRLGPRKNRAVSLIAAPSVTSTQVLSELASVMRRKLGFTPLAAQDVLRELCERLEVSLISSQTVLDSLDLAQRRSLLHYDSQILASALESGCQVLYSEDMQEGLVIERRLRIVNPFTTFTGSQT